MIAIVLKLRQPGLLRPRQLFLGGMALSLVVGSGALLAAYFADTAPLLPSSIAALETLGPAAGTWPALKDRPPVHIARATAPSGQKLALLPRSPDAAEAPPIDLSDLPPTVSSAQ